GATKDFAFAYPYRAAADLTVYLRTISPNTGAEALQSLTTHYSLVSAVSDASTGGFSSVTIRFVTAPPATTEVHIVRRVAATSGSAGTKGLPPIPQAGDQAKVLRGDWTWANVAGGGSGAPDDGDYLVKTANGSLSAERVVTDTSRIAVDWATAGQAKFDLVA